MNKLTIFWLLLLCFTSVLYAQNYYYNDYGNDAVLLEQIRVLTFNKGQMTTGRRSAPLPQLQCVGGSATGQTEYYPSAVQCTNMGSDGSGNVQWKCEADLDSSVRFGTTTVSCEGYSQPDDPYILKGSCGLEYSLEFTEQGRQNKAQYHGYSNYNNNYNTPYYQENGSGFGQVVLFIILAFIIIGILRQCNQNAQRNYNSGGTGYYSQPYDSPPSYPGYNPGMQGMQGSYPKPYPDNTYRPGFWSGVGTGGLLGYLFRPRTTGYGPSYGPGYRSQSWGSSPSGSFGSFGSNSSPRTASAFASTRRR